MLNKLLEGLNDDQIKAVTTTEGYVRVIAGAGSGKTKALTTRFAYLVDELDISPSKILSVTFTNKAANEMKERIMKLLGSDTPIPYIMTFHSFCNRFLRSEIEVLGISENFKIMDTEDQTDILKVVYSELGITHKDIPYKKALQDIIGAGCKTGDRVLVGNYEELLAKYSSAEFHKLMQTAEQRELKIIYGYLREQKRDACLDYDDLLNLAVYILKTHKDVREFWENAFDYIQVDEFQDVSLREVELVGYLSNKCNNLFVVGDDSQCVVEGSLVETPDGVKKIEEIKMNDLVMSGIGNSEIDSFKVEKVMKKPYKGKILDIYLSNGSKISVTPEHGLFAIRDVDMDTDTPCLYLFDNAKKDKKFRTYGHVIHTNTEGNKEIADIDMAYKKVYKLSDNPYVMGHFTLNWFLQSKAEDLVVGDMLPTLIFSSNPSVTNSLRSSLQKDRCGGNGELEDKGRIDEFLLVGEIRIDKYSEFIKNEFTSTELLEGQGMSGSSLSDLKKKGIILEDEEAVGKRLQVSEIVKIEERDYEGYVYDINVRNTRNYFVNGCLVHNCIYSFRGSDVNCILHFGEIMNKLHGREDSVTSIYLTTNYRSTPEILDVSNSLIKCNKNRLDKTLVAHNGNGPKVLHYHARNIYTEATWVANRILSLKRPFKDFAILYRSHATSRAIEEKLIENSINYEVLSGISFYSRKEVKDIFAILSLMAFGDNLSFQRCVKTLSLGIGPKKIEILRELAGPNGNLYSALRANIETKSFKNTKGPWLVEFIENLRDYEEIESISMLMGRIYTSLNLEEEYIKGNEEERWENLQELKKSAQHFEHSQGEKVSVADYLNMMSLYTNQDKEENPDTVKLMTVHGAKGLEFPVVFVVGMNEGVMPTSRTMSVEAMEEERRIAYVAMTRAKELLFLSDAEGENYDKSYRLPSRFLLNIPRDLYNSEGKIDEYLWKQTQQKIDEDSRKMGDTSSSILDKVTNVHQIVKGDRVRHKVFGEGKVMEKTDVAYVILFDNVGVKGIRLDTTKLEKII